jgi:hypothetical protein
VWLYIPSLSVLEEPQDSNWDYPSLAEKLSRSVTWRGKLRLSRLWLRAWKKGRSPLRQCGVISQLSMEQGFAAWLTSFQQASPASPTPLPEKEKDTRTNAPSGPNSYEWWERCSRGWYSSKMSLSFLNTFESSEKNYKDWATWLRNRYSSQPPMLAPRTSDYESSSSLTWNTPTSMEGYRDNDGPKSMERRAMGEMNKSDRRLRNQVSDWPTPRAEDGESCGNHPNSESDSLTGVTKTWNTPKTARGNYTRDHGNPEMERPSLGGQAEMWRTPDAPGTTGGPRNRQGSKDEGHQVTIAEQAEMWQTPAPDSFRSRSGDRVDEMGLDQQARFWPSPAAASPNSLRGSGEDPEIRRAGGHQIMLQDVVSTWPSPQARDFRSGETKSDYGNPRPLNEIVMGWPSPSASMMTTEDMEQARYAGTDPRRPEYSEASPSLQDRNTPVFGEESLKPSPGLRRRLNPAFVAWLMGLPWWWTNPGPISSARSETEWYLSRQRWHLRFLLSGQDFKSKD